MNSAIIVAAGSGTRFGSEVPKQFLEIAGKPVVVHALERFENCRTIDEIVLVLAAAEIERFQLIVERFDLKKLSKIVSGGDARAASVLNGLNAVDARRAEIVAVHDGARPLVTTDEISRTIEAARATGAACLTAAVTDTIKETANGKIVGTVDRRKLRRALTPQCFRFEILKRAFESADSSGATDECSLVEQLGVDISTVEGSPKNIKITTPEDFALAEILLAQTANSKNV